ncbi:MAG: MFS transporter, partial [Hyphomonadaceae bacterium]
MSEIADEGAPLSESTAKPRAGSEPDWLVPAIIGSALLMQNLSATVIANALPAMAHALNVDPVAMNLAITSFLLSGAVFLPISGWLADRYGARPVFIAAIVIFTLASAACGFANSLEQLIAARVVQGAASAMLMPVGRLVLLRTVPKSELVGALAIVTMPALFGPMLGPPIGGLIVTFGDWRWIFFLNAPIGIVGMFLVWRYVPDVREDVRVPMDWIGFALAGVACAALVFGFENLGRGGLPWPIALAILLTGAAAAWAFGWHARRIANPILDPSILRYKTFSASVLGGSFMRLGIGASPFLLALLFQLAFGMSAFHAGLVTCTAAAGALAMKAVAPPLIRRFGFRTILIWNGFITTAFFLAYALFQPEMPYALLVAILLVGGFFRSL